VPLIWQCNSCGGKYNDTMPDGGNYAHSCPVMMLDSDGETVLRPYPRNENLVVSRQRIETGIIAEGKGVTCLNDPAFIEPRWISELKARTAKREGANSD
jgi:hypothetical protein